MIGSRGALPWLVLPLVLLAGCGDARTPVPSLSQPAAPGGFHRLGYRSLGLSFGVPRDWSILHRRAGSRAPLVTVVSGAATVAFWRYPRSRPRPLGAVRLQQAGAELIAAARARDPGLQVIRFKLIRVDHAAAIELDAVEQIAGQTRRVRSTHLFVRGAELVVDEYAPVREFRSVDRAVFSPLRRSLRLLAAPPV